MIILCPSNCEHTAYDFQHSIITTETTEMVDDEPFRVTTSFIVCRECGHWINMRGPCFCRYRCHEEEGGMEVVTTPFDVIGCP